MEPSRIARWTLIASILGSSMAFIDGSVVNVALPSIQARPRRRARDAAVGRRRLPAHARLADPRRRLARRHLRRVAHLRDRRGELRAGARSSARSPRTRPRSSSSARLQGMAGALLVPASLAMITATFSGAARGAAIGQWTAWTGISFVVGPTLGGWLVDVSSWRRDLHAQHADRGRHAAAPARGSAGYGRSGGATCASTCGARSSARPGSVCSSPASSSSRSAAGAIRSSSAASSAAPLLLGAFVVYELRTSAPMLPLRLFRLRNFSVANIETLAVYGGLSGADHVPDALPDRVRRLLGVAGRASRSCRSRSSCSSSRRVRTVVDAARAAPLHGGRSAHRGSRRARVHAPAR